MFAFTTPIGFSSLRAQARFTLAYFVRGSLQLVRRAAQADPIGMKCSRPIDALIRMRSEIIALGLQQVRRQSLAADGVEICQCRAKRRHRNPALDRDGHGPAPAGLRFFDRFGEIRREQQILQL